MYYKTIGRVKSKLDLTVTSEENNKTYIVDVKKGDEFPILKPIFGEPIISVPFGTDNIAAPVKLTDADFEIIELKNKYSKMLKRLDNF